MHTSRSMRSNLFVALPLLLGATMLTPIRAAADCYVSTGGSDASGDGSSGRPWASIQHAIDHGAACSSGGSLVIRVAGGEYVGDVSARASVTILGASDTPTVLHGASAGAIVTVASATARPTFRMKDVEVRAGDASSGGLVATHALVHLTRVHFRRAGSFVVALRDVGTAAEPFSIVDCSIDTDGPVYADVGISTASSTGTIRGLEAGDYIDHIIDIQRGSRIWIEDCTLTGSPIHYADGIRVTGNASVDVENVSIHRPTWAEYAFIEPLHEYPYSGIEISASRDPYADPASVRIRGVTTSGFDSGVGIMLDGTPLGDGRALVPSVSVETSFLEGVTAGVLVLSRGDDAPRPVVDLGGGALGSVGQNYFGAGPWSIVNLDTADVSALWNTWTGPGAVDERIWDGLDSPGLGRVLTTRVVVPTWIW